MPFRGDFNYPTAVKAGRGRFAELPQHLRALGITRPLVVTDPFLATQPFLVDMVATLAREGFGVACFSSLRGNPIGRNVDDGTQVFRAGDHDGVVAIGGGSALDVGKAVALLSGQSGALFDYEDVGDRWLSILPSGIAPIIAVPTTAGTGSEVGRASVITDESTRTKRIVFHPKMQPSVVLLDSELTYGLPPALTAATGMDALSHCLEAYCAPGFHPMAAGIALEGTRLVHEHLEVAYREPESDDARMAMLVASSMGATAFQRGLGAMHALAHPLGALYDAHHGTLNAVLMPYVLVANRGAIEERIVAMSRYLGLGAPTFAAFLGRILELRETLRIPHALSSLGVDDECRDVIGALAVADPSSATNPIPLSADAYRGIFESALRGTL